MTGKTGKTNVEIPKEKKTLKDDETHDDETHDDDRSVQRRHHHHHDLERIQPTCDAYDSYGSLGK